MLKHLIRNNDIKGQNGFVPDKITQTQLLARHKNIIESLMPGGTMGTVFLNLAK